MPPRCLLAVSLLAACSGVPPPSDPPKPVMPPPPTAPAPPTPPADRPPDEPPPVTPTTPAPLSGRPLGRLNVVDNVVVALDHPLPRADLTALGVRSYRAFTATTPQVWLLVFEFESQARLLAALPKISALVGDDDAPPYDRETSYTGAWLLVTGFPSHKPVSPEMAAARTVFTSQWAGEE